MSDIKDNIFQTFCNLSQKVQNLQTQIKTESVTPKKRVAFHKALELLQDIIESLNLETDAISKRFEDVNRQIISLYREVEERFEEYEISLISKEAFEIGKALEKGKIFSVAKRVNDLRHNIQFIFKDRRPSMKHRKIILLAQKFSDEILFPQGKTAIEHLKLIQMLKTLLQEAVVKADSMVDPFDEELAMELYEIIDLFEHRKSGEARMRLNLIRSKFSLAQRRRLDAEGNTPKEMIEILLEIASGDPCVEWDLPEKKESVIHMLHA